MILSTKTVVPSHTEDMDITRVKGVDDNSISNAKYFEIDSHIEAPFAKTEVKSKKLCYVVSFSRYGSTLVKDSERIRKYFDTFVSLTNRGENNV